MSENIERLRRAYAGDPDPDLLAPDFELHQSPSIIDTDGIFRGRDAIRDVVRELDESFEDMRWEPEKFIEIESRRSDARDAAEAVASRLTTT